MNTDQCSLSNSRIPYLRKLAKRRACFTSVHLILVTFAVAMAFGGIMKAING